MDVRVAVPADIPGIARVHFESWRTTYPGLIPAAYLADLTLEGRESLWRANFKAPLGPLFVAVDGPRIVGFAYAGPCRAKDTPYVGEIYALYVLDDVQGRGVGRRLFRTGAEALLGLGLRSMVVWVLESNPSRGFYEAMGGRLAGAKKFLMGGAFLTEVAYGWEDVTATRGGAAAAPTAST
jgi:GNAT superfamily N-acetyltransferase